MVKRIDETTRSATGCFLVSGALNRTSKLAGATRASQMIDTSTKMPYPARNQIARGQYQVPPQILAGTRRKTAKNAIWINPPISPFAINTSCLPLLLSAIVSPNTAFTSEVFVKGVVENQLNGSGVNCVGLTHMLLRGVPSNRHSYRDLLLFPEIRAKSQRQT